MKENVRVLFQHDDQILAEKVLYQFLIVIGSIWVPSFLIYNRYEHLYLSIPFILALGILLFILVELDYRAKKEFAVTNNGIIITINHLYPLYKKRPRTAFIPFSSVKRITHSRIPPNTRIKVQEGKEYSMFLNMYELKKFKRILQDQNIENNIRVHI